jgi:hypothetical protein
MARFSVSPAAIDRLRQLRSDAGQGAEVVIIYWEGPQTDSRRLPDGGTEWVRVSEGEWCVGFVSRTKVQGENLEVIAGLEFLVSEYPSKDNIDGRTVDYANGKFLVR